MAQSPFGPLPANPKLSVVMPVYNERTTVEAIVRHVLATWRPVTAMIFKRGYRVDEIPILHAGRNYDEGKKTRGVGFARS